METEEVSNRFVAPCFVNGLEVYDGEINLGVKENMISNEYAVKLCLERDVKRGNKVVTKELIVAVRGEIYFVKFIINPEEDDVEPGMRKSSRNKKRAMENLNLFYQDIGTSSSAGGHLTQEEAAKEELAIKMSRKFALLEEERPIIETMAYHDKYTKILDEVWKDKVELDGKIVKEEEEAVKRIKGEALKEKDDPEAFIYPIRLEGQVNKNALTDTGSDINTMPFRIYVQLGREYMKKVDRRITMINHTQAEVQTFRAARSDVMRNTKSDSDDQEDYQIKQNKFGAPIYGPKHAPYLNLQLKNVNWKPDYKVSYTKEEAVIGQWRTEIRLWEHTMIRPDHQDPNALDNMKLWKRYCFHKFTMSSYDGKDVTEMQSLDNFLVLPETRKRTEDGRIVPAKFLKQKQR
nr:hypothetical protein [Tanacetum cinerariifolium]